MKKSRVLFLAAITVVLLMPGCPDISKSAESPVLRTIGDAAHGGPADNFYFLPPMVDYPEYSGVFDPELSPVVSIPSLDTTFTMDSGHGSERIRVSENNEHYIVNWHTKKYHLQAGDLHRILVLVGGVEVGFVDVQIVDKGSDVASVDEGLYVAVKNRRTLPIKFRIETGTPVTGLVLDPVELSLQVDGSAQLTATVDPPDATDPSVSWLSSNQSVAAVDDNGLVTALAEGITIITVSTASGGYTADCAVTVLTKPLDAFVVNYQQEKSLWFNDGDAVFSLNQSLPPGVGRDVALGDLDNDGDLDAYVANLGPDEVWMNNDGVFGLKVQTSPPPPLNSLETDSVALGFIDDDEYLDAVTVNGTTCFYLNGNIDGSFTLNETLAIGSARDVALGDLDGDGDMDLLTSGYGGTRYWTYHNDTFVSTGSMYHSGDTFDIELGDLNDDGNLDAVVTSFNSVDSEVWINQTPVTDPPSPINFSRSQFFGNYRVTRSLSLGDIDGDSDLDAFLGNVGSPGEVWFNDGSGYFSYGESYSEATNTRDVSLGDLDGDGDLDAFIVRGSNGGDLVLLNDGFGVFSDSGQSLGLSMGNAVALGPLLH